ncbi:Rab GTPase-binding exocyst subunit SEC15 KNAG_0B00360 [Huiozyma naganishii CBS 8797]|uniref:Exocyst complex component SEC15 n=1 Tax=Huiozyma naganishii (strain ATCC MYA-139 / BCRC 22969 / CBS 8797 / KCTC 17520 / NBRC 10181 / NCYC 3082 / Yp74L-3) TaxID=1071383 RepID=J7R131_HUIN7|nr:hypothetical protein KNAG_0B00360 [Kazachstania naganishii CBS 8797]CCK68485.1 hypothetical protein KNAG_0B00360 [Kazachstania naganishii CBS 8797]
MEQDLLLTQEFQKILLNSASVTTPLDADRKGLRKNSIVAVNSSDTKSLNNYEDAFDLDPQAFDKWIPFLRTSLEKNQIDTVVEELEASIDDNFQDLEFQLLQDAQINDKLASSIGKVSGIQSTIEGDLLREVESFQSLLTQSTNELISKKQICVNNNKTSLKITEATILINKVVQLLEISSKCQQLIKERKFFKALQNLDYLEQLYLQEFKDYNFQFLKEIYESVPLLKSVTKDECLNLVKNSFNSNLGKNLSSVGGKVFSAYQDKLLPSWSDKKNTMKLYHNFKFNSPVEISTRDQSVLKSIVLDSFFNLDEFYDSIMIFQKLNEFNNLLPEFTKEYEFRRTKLIHPLLWKKTSISNINSVPGDISMDPFTKQMNLEFLKEYFLKILGFLLYDINLNRSTDFILVNNNYNATNEFWDGLMNRLQPYLRYFLKHNLTTEEDLIQFKDFVSILCCILENYKLSINPLYEIAMETLEKYCQMNIRAFDEEFTSLFNGDDFMPLVVSDPVLYDKVIKICWLTEDKELRDAGNKSRESGVPFSVVLPFSPLYPMTCTLTKKIYSKLTTFVADFYRHELAIVNRILVGTIETIFNNIVNKKIREKLDSKSREEISQILINLDYFIIAAKEFGMHMTKENILQNPDVEIKLTSIKEFTDSRKMAESKLIELIDSKISDILETVNFDWTANEIRHEPDISIIDLGQFLQMMFASTLVNLPYSVQTLLVFREFDSLTRKVLDILLHETPSRITQEGAHNFGVDVKYLQDIIPSLFPSLDFNGENTGLSASVGNTPVTPSTPTFSGSVDDGASTVRENKIRSLEETFTELNQCIALLTTDNWDEYLDSDVRMKKYSRIKRDEALLLIEKVRTHNYSAASANGDVAPQNDSRSGTESGADTGLESSTNRLANSSLR